MLAQLGNRIQHALRAFTPEDADALQKTVRTYPKSDLYDLEQLLTELGIGEAAVTVLSERGVPTPVVHTPARASVEDGARFRPRRRGGRIIRCRRSTEARLEAERPRAARSRLAQAAEPEAKPARKPAARKKSRQPASTGDPVTDFLTSREGQRLGKEVVRGVFGLLKKRL